MENLNNGFSDEENPISHTDQECEAVIDATPQENSTEEKNLTVESYAENSDDGAEKIDNTNINVMSDSSFYEPVPKQIDLFNGIDEPASDEDGEESILSEIPSTDESASQDEKDEGEEFSSDFELYGNISVVSEQTSEEGEAPTEENEVLEGQLEMDFATSTEEAPSAEPIEQPKKKKGYDPDNPRKIDSAFDFVELFIFALVAVLIFTTFFFRHSVVEGSSMENTLHDGEHLIISSFFYEPQRGDIVVCEDYSTPHKKPIVKRIIALEGDRIQVSIDGKVTLNGEELVEDYVFVNGRILEHPVDLVVGEGEIFVMGDHRNMSDDSRSFGPVDEDSIIGKVLIRFYPFDKFGSVD